MKPDPLIWKNWLGYEHEIGADPRFTNKCCCFKLVQALYEELNLGYVPFSEEFYILFKENRTAELLDTFYSNTVEVPFPRIWSIVQFNINDKFGMGIIVQDAKFLVPHHHMGLQAFSIRLLPPESRRYFIPV